MKKFIFLIPLLSLILASCLGTNTDDVADYAAWQKLNNSYVDSLEKLTVNGEKVYTKITTSWAPREYVLIKWHNDRKATEKNLVPITTSTVDIKYKLTNINGLAIDSSYNQKAYGDSIYRSSPSSNVMGMWIAMTTLHVGDSVTLVIPYASGYGYSGSGSVLPYSTLIFDMKLKGIHKYDAK